MKKYLVVLLAVMLTAGCLGLLGCGGDTGKAKENMETADAAFAALEKKLDEMGKLSEELIGAAVTGNLAAITPEKVQRVSALVTEVAPEIEAVKADYQKILELKGVDDYAEYATTMIAALDAQAVSVKAGGELLAKLVPVLQSGDPAQISAAIKDNAAGIATVQDLSKATDMAFAAAKKIKTDKNLGE